MKSPPILVTRVHVGKGPGIVLISLSTPSGDLGKGPVENVEAVRVAMTFSTFREVSDLFAHTMKEIQMPSPQVPEKWPLPVMDEEDRLGHIVRKRN